MLIDHLKISERSKLSLKAAGFESVGSILNEMFLHTDSYIFREFGAAKHALFELRDWLKTDSLAKDALNQDRCGRPSPDIMKKWRAK